MTAGPINCEEVIEQLFAFLDQELDDETRERIDEHMARCRDCFSRAEFERRLRQRVQETAEIQPPDRLIQRLRRIVDEF